MDALGKLIAQREKSRGLLIAFEGPDGSGKTTQRKLLTRWLESRDHQVVSTRWASSALIKPLLKVRKKIRTLSTEEYSLLHAVDFRHRVETSILPALWAGKTVLADRYLFTALARDAARVFIYAYWSASAREAHEGQSVFSRPGGGTRIGERLTSRPVQLFSDPAYEGLQSAPFVTAASSDNISSVFDNGLPLSRTHWVKDGMLEALLQTRHSAAMTGQPVTPGIDNLVLQVDDADGSMDALVGDTERGLLVTCLWYIRVVDPQTLLLTGLTRDGVYLVENGEVTGVVNNFRFNESPVDLLGRFSDASRTVPAFSREWGDYFSRTAMPALRVPDFNMSSVSQAN